jgi:hypothetical protein
MALKPELDDVEAIREQIALYCLYADEAQFDDIGQLLSDADIYLGDRQIAGRSAETVRAMFANAKRPSNGGRRHLTTNIIVTLQSQDAASAVSYFTWVETLAGEAPKILQCGVYRDRFERRAGAWRFVERRIHADGAPVSKS